MQFYYLRSSTAFELWWETTFGTNPQGWLGAYDSTGIGNNYQYNGLGLQVAVPQFILNQKICATPLNGSCLQYNTPGPCLARSPCTPNTAWDTCQIQKDVDPALPQSNFFSK